MASSESEKGGDRTLEVDIQSMGD